MTDLRATEIAIVADDEDGVNDSAVSWAAVAAGAVAAAALTLLLMAFGAGTGLSSISPWSNSGVSATTFSVGAGIYLVVAAMLASSIGGYLAGRLRIRWVGVHSDEVYFRDTAHGFLAWAFATVLSAAVLGAASTAIVSGLSAGLSQTGPSAGGPADIYVDELFRPTPGASAQAGVSAPSQPAPCVVAAAANQARGDREVRAEVSRVLLKSFRDRSDLAAADRTYVAQLVASRTGVSQADAEKRVNDVIAKAKSDIDKARSAAAKLALWLAAAMLVGAFAASLAAIEGGQLRDRRGYP
jgi:tellurite resistance protein